jgi:3-methyl-2-oxobutanoate hydroxymethyltransferase
MDPLRAKAEERKLSMVTCYDFTFAHLVSKSPVDGILVGDSAAMVMQGHPSTLSASTELMRPHGGGRERRRGHAPGMAST